VYHFRWIKSGKISTSLAWSFAVILVLFSGIAYRVLASRLRLLVYTSISLPLPLSAFPMQIDNWQGKELPIPNITKEYMERHFADDFISRRYVNAATKAWADVYVVYCSSQPGGILGHRPRVCYPAHGWIHESTQQSQVISLTGRVIPCLVHHFHKPSPESDEIVILNFYILNGLLTDDESVFSGVGWRTPNIASNPAHYVSQVQISSVLESSIRIVAEEMTDLILDFFPDEKNEVKVAKFETTKN